MITASAIRQLSRILGRDSFYQHLGLDERGEALALTPEQVTLVHGLVQERLQQVIDALLAEALANDDILSAEAADAYLEERLAAFAELLTLEQRQEVRRRYRAVSARWA